MTFREGRRHTAKGKRVSAFCILPCALILFFPGLGAAQTARNPFADLFGRAPSEDGAELKSLHWRTTAGAQIGQTIRADFDQQDVVPEGVAAAADASLIARYLTNRVQAQGHGRYSYQEFRKQPAFGAPGFDAGGRINFNATTRLSLFGGGQFMRSPFFRLMWFTPNMIGSSAPATASSAILMQSNDTVDGTAGFAAKAGRRVTFEAMGFGRQTRFADAPLSDFQSVGGRATLKRQLTRSLGLRAGYVREELSGAPGGSGDRYVNEVIDAGVDFARSFSMGRRTSLAFATETSFVRHDGERDFRLNGFVAFDNRFYRTWITQLWVRRGTEFVPGYKAAVFTDRGGATLAGYLAKRVLFEAHGEGGRGAVGVGGRAGVNRFISYNADASMTFALTRNFGVFTQYYYFHYQMPPDPLALATVRHLSRQAVSVGVKTWVSIIDKEKVPRDPR